MGDVGSLPLGAALGTVAVISKQELLLILVGGVFVIEALSVIFQVALLQVPGQAGLPDGADSSSFRAEGLGRAESRGPTLDPRGPVGALQFEHLEVAMRAAMSDGLHLDLQGKRVAVIGFGRSGQSALRLLTALGAHVPLPIRNRHQNWRQS